MLSQERLSEGMKCKDVQRMIPAFLSGELENRELKPFLLHMESCPECMEELTIQYLVMTGASLLEEGKSFDLREELNGLMLSAWSRVHRRNILTWFSYILEILAIIIVIFILVMVIF